MILNVRPSSLLKGCVPLPPSKSYTIRAFMIAACGGRSMIIDPSDCDDALASIKVAQALGASVKRQGGGRWSIIAKEKKQKLTRVNVKESGTVLRFILPLLCLEGRKVEVAGDTPLLKPMSRVAGWISGLWGALYARAGIDYSQDVDPETGIIKPERVEEINQRFLILYDYIKDHFEELKAGTFRLPEYVLRKAGLPNEGAKEAVFLSVPYFLIL